MDRIVRINGGQVSRFPPDGSSRRGDASTIVAI
jgi:hypothetical protein